jgi:CRISPR-associated protein Cmr4
METKILAVFTRTPLHVGAGNSVGAVDSPIMRERHTRIPIIPGSSLKGVISDLWNDDCEKDKKGGMIRKKDSQAETLFGSQDDKNAKAGSLLIGEARALLFPVRSAKGSFSWITCPLALARFKRDGDLKIADILLEDMNCHGGAAVTLGRNVILEEYSLTSVQTACKDMEKELVKLIPAEMKSLAEGRITVVSDEIFSYFCENACEIVTRIRVDDETGTAASSALFHQEQVPSETLFYSVIAQKSGDAINALKSKLESRKNIIQIGGNETIGLGYCTVTLEG